MFQDIEPHTFDYHYQVDVRINDRDLIFFYKENQILLKKIKGTTVIPTKMDLQNLFDETSAIYLFSIDQQACFLAEHVSGDLSDFEYEEVINLRNWAGKEIVWAGAVAFHLRNWYISNKYCGRCGSKTKAKSEERALTCDSCSSVIYPKISPAVIVAITCRDKILLAKGKHYKGNFYSLVAGYVDIGESLEKAIVREVKEEIGIGIKNIRYYKSQPWPFSGSLMVGFFAEADENQPIVIDEHEIAEAGWYRRDSLPNHSSSFSIAGEMIELFKNSE